MSRSICVLTQYPKGDHAFPVRMVVCSVGVEHSFSFCVRRYTTVTSASVFEWGAELLGLTASTLSRNINTDFIEY